MPETRKPSRNALYGQLSTELPYGIRYDHVWKLGNTFGIATGVGFAKVKDDGILFPVSASIVNGKGPHHIEVGTTFLFDPKASNPYLLGSAAYRYQSFKKKVFIRGGVEIGKDVILPFASIGIGF